MITRNAHVREVTRRVLGDGSISHSALVTFDESAATTIRLTAADAADLESAIKAKRRFTVTLGIAAPSIADLAARDDAKAST